jgi:hypothetical protein
MGVVARSPWRASSAIEGDHHEHGNGFDRRHPRGVILTRVLVTAWLLALTGILLAYPYRVWALVTLAGAAASLVWAYRVYRAAMH